jgi:hypothetical protein
VFSSSQAAKTRNSKRSNLPDEEGEEIEVSGFGLHGIVPGKPTTFRYAGSTPPSRR